MGILERVSGRPVFKKILENSGWQIGDRVVRLGLNFFITAWIARYLGPESYGKLSYVIAFVSIFQVFSTLGIEWIVLKEFSDVGVGGVSARDGAESSRKLITLVKLRILTGLIGQMLLFVTLKVVGGEISVVVMAMAQSFLLLFQAFDTIDYWFQSRMRMGQVVVIRSIGFFTASALRISLLLKQAPVEAFIAPFLIEMVIANFLLVNAWRSENREAFGRFWSAFEISWVNELKRKIPTVFLTAIFLQMYLRIDQLLLQWMLGPAAVGIFSIPVRLSEIFYLVGAAIIGSSAPALFSVFRDEPLVFRQRTEKLLRMLNLGSVMICVGTVALAEPVVTFIFGEQYLASISVLKVYIWCLPAVLQGGVRNIWLMAGERTGFALFAAGLGTVLSLVLNFVMIPRFGVLGSAVSAVVAMWVSGIVSSFFDASLRPVAWMQVKSFFPRRILEG